MGGAGAEGRREGGGSLAEAVLRSCNGRLAIGKRRAGTAGLGGGKTAPRARPAQ